MIVNAILLAGPLTLPSHHLATIAGWHNVGEDGEIGAGLCPGSQDAEASNECKVGSKASRASRNAVELQEDQGDANGHRDLRTERSAVVAETPGKGISHHASNDVAEHPHDGALRGEDACLPVLQTAQLEVEQVVAHDTPRDRAKNALHNHDTKCWDAQKIHDCAELCAHSSAALLVRGSIDLMRWLHEEASNPSSNAESHKARTCEEEAPARDVTHVRVRNVPCNKQGAEHAEKESTLHSTEDFAAAVV